MQQRLSLLAIFGTTPPDSLRLLGRATEIFQNFFHAIKRTAQLTDIKEVGHIAQYKVFHTDVSKLLYLAYDFVWGTIDIVIFTKLPIDSVQCILCRFSIIPRGNIIEKPIEVFAKWMLDDRSNNYNSYYN